MAKLNDHDRLHLDRSVAQSRATAHHDGRCGVRLFFRGEEIALATTGMASSLSVAEQEAAARRIAAVWNLARGLSTDAIERKLREIAEAEDEAGREAPAARSGMS